ncbi:MAG: Gfo/Idh/MocA family oxidoreductase [Ignavibacteriaceae bacterium]|nr:Gfo/Idh/MocA family oxidoreductase [Ignavibacteriaceae bacterium]
MKNFAITGIAGYIAPRHLQAIKETGNVLVAAMDTHDSVGTLDKYFPNASFFTEYERFDRHLEKLKRSDAECKIDYLSVCSPNNLHDAHIRLALRVDADAICEKPLVLNPWNLDALNVLEKEFGKRVYTVLQLRLHDSLINLKEKLIKQSKKKKHNVELTYITSRGIWYDYSWKGNIEKSGGIATNIGIHFFDMLIWLFGSVNSFEVQLSEKRRMGGFIELENANVKWFLSINYEDLPETVKTEKKSTYRSIKVDSKEIEFTEGFTNLHIKTYDKIIHQQGFGIEDARNSIELVHKIRNAKVSLKLDKEIIHYDTKKYLGVF